MAYEIIVAKFTPDEPDERIDAVLPDGVVGIGAKAFRFKGEVRSLARPPKPHRGGGRRFRRLPQPRAGRLSRRCRYGGKARFPTLHLAARDNVR